MNTSIIKTVQGRTIMVQWDETSPRPYTIEGVNRPQRAGELAKQMGGHEGMDFPDFTRGDWKTTKSLQVVQ